MFLKGAKASINYEHLCLWFRDLGGELWQADMLETQSGHLMIPVQGQLYDLSRLRSEAEKDSASHFVRMLKAWWILCPRRMP